jgi:hypothetical protein
VSLVFHKAVSLRVGYDPGPPPYMNLAENKSTLQLSSGGVHHSLSRGPFKKQVQPRGHAIINRQSSSDNTFFCEGSDHMSGLLHAMIVKTKD